MSSSCIKVLKGAWIVCSENGRVARFENKRPFLVSRIHVDGCEIKNQKIEKCDYRLVVEKRKNDFGDEAFYAEEYIELKGKDFEKAVSQIRSTINIKSSDPKKKRKRAVIVMTGSPAKTKKRDVLQLQLKREMNADLVIRTRLAQLKIV